MYRFDKKTEDAIRGELHKKFDAGITHLPSSLKIKKCEHIVSGDFTTDFEGHLIQLLSTTVEMFEGNCYPCVINTVNQKNALAGIVKNVPVIAVHLFMVADCVSLAHAYMMFDDFFAMTYPTVRYDYTYKPATIDEHGNLSFVSPKSNEKKIMADMIAYLSVKFILLHESAHHSLNHVKNTAGKKNTASKWLYSNAGDNMTLNGIQSQALETEADTWATARLLRDFIQIKKCFDEQCPQELSYLDVVKALYLAVLIPLLNNDHEYTKEMVLSSSHPPSFMRYNDVKVVFGCFFGIKPNESHANEFWHLVKDEMINDYANAEWKRESYIDMLRRYDVPTENVDVYEKVKEDDIEYVKYFVLNWFTDVFVYIVLRFRYMHDEDCVNIVEVYRNVLEINKQLESEGVYDNRDIRIEV